MSATSSKSSVSERAVTVTGIGVAQFIVVKSTFKGETVATSVSRLVRVTVTSAVGAAAMATVYVSSNPSVISSSSLDKSRNGKD